MISFPGWKNRGPRRSKKYADGHSIWARFGRYFSGGVEADIDSRTHTGCAGRFVGLSKQEG